MSHGGPANADAPIPPMSHECSNPTDVILPSYSHGCRRNAGRAHPHRCHTDVAISQTFPQRVTPTDVMRPTCSHGCRTAAHRHRCHTNVPISLMSHQCSTPTASLLKRVSRHTTHLLLWMSHDRPLPTDVTLMAQSHRSPITTQLPQMWHGRPTPTGVTLFATDVTLPRLSHGWPALKDVT